MPILFHDNDPGAAPWLPRTIAPHSKRNFKKQADFLLASNYPERVYEYGSREFLHWQVREAALRALTSWESLTDEPLPRWLRHRRMRINPLSGTDRVAVFDGYKLTFGEVVTTSGSTYAGASIDIVAHEVGHAILDTLRPVLWRSSQFEVNAFHESFGDCVALFTSLSDAQSRSHLLDGGLLRQPNPVETFGEQVASAKREAREDGDAVLQSITGPRHARNSHRWQPLNSLEADPPPHLLAKTPHSFGQIFTGCIYDLIVEIYSMQPEPGGDALLNATAIAARLLMAGARKARTGSTFLNNVASAMVEADKSQYNGTHRQALKAAFGRHGLEGNLGENPTPIEGLSGTLPVNGLHGFIPSLPRKMRRSLLTRLRVPMDAQVAVRPSRFRGGPALDVEVCYRVELQRFHAKLRGSAATAVETVTLCESDGDSVILQPLPDRDAEDHAIGTMVLYLVETGRVSTGKRTGGDAALHSHSLRNRKRGRYLRRVRYVC